MAKKKPIPFDFILEELAPLMPYTKPMFGCTAVYVGDLIVFILRKRDKNPDDNGIWLATTLEHHESLKRELPSLRSIRLFGSPETGWQNLPWNAHDFEEAALHACEIVRKGDPRIGKVSPSIEKAKRKARKLAAEKTSGKKLTKKTKSRSRS